METCSAIPSAASRARVRSSRQNFLIVSAIVAGSTSAQATGHGPVYALSTPPLPQGAWSLDIGAMYWRSAHQAAMVRPMLGYGITPDLELTLSVPVPIYHEVPEHFPTL